MVTPGWSLRVPMCTGAPPSLRSWVPTQPSMTSLRPQWRCGCLRRRWAAVNWQKSSTQTTKTWSICPVTSCPPMWWARQRWPVIRCTLSVWCCRCVSPCFLLSLSLSLRQLAVPDLVESVMGADILIFVVPHQFILRVCDTIKDHVKKDAVGMSLIKVTFFLLSAFPCLHLWVRVLPFTFAQQLQWSNESLVFPPI